MTFVNDMSEMEIKEAAIKTEDALNIGRGKIIPIRAYLPNDGPRSLEQDLLYLEYLRQIQERGELSGKLGAMSYYERLACLFQ
jgi:hypothetical protein